MKKGFTLVELLGVIVILAILMVLLVPNVTKTSQGARNKAYSTKMDLIEDSAITFGQDNYRKIIDNADKGTTGYSKEVKDGVTYRIQTLMIKDLVPDYVTADSDSSKGLIEDPRENGKYLDEYVIEIRINPNTRKVTAKVQNR